MCQGKKPLTGCGVRSSGDRSWCSHGGATDDRNRLVGLTLSMHQHIWVGVTLIEFYFETAMQGIIDQAAITAVRIRFMGVVCI